MQNHHHPQITKGLIVCGFMGEIAAELKVDLSFFSTNVLFCGFTEQTSIVRRSYVNLIFKPILSLLFVLSYGLRDGVGPAVIKPKPYRHKQ